MFQNYDPSILTPIRNLASLEQPFGISINKQHTTDGLYSKKTLKTLMELDKTLKRKILGQENAIDSTVWLIKLSYAKLRNKNKPVAIFLYTGPTGTGKTELAKQLAEELNRHLIRFDLSEFQEKVAITRLIGASAGYVGFEDGGLLVNAINEHPQAVLLLDEIDKAHPDIFNVFLQIMDYAILTDSHGRKADFRNVIIIMTSNAGAKDIGKKLIGFGDNINDYKVVDHALEQMFSPEFRNRIDAVIKFNHLSPETINSIVRKEIKEFTVELKAEKNITLFINEDCIEHLAKESYSREFGARYVSRFIEKNIKSLLVNEILFGSLSNGGSVRIDWRQSDGYYMEIMNYDNYHNFKNI